MRNIEDLAAEVLPALRGKRITLLQNVEAAKEILAEAEAELVKNNVLIGAIEHVTEDDVQIVTAPVSPVVQKDAPTTPAAPPTTILPLKPDSLNLSAMVRELIRNYKGRYETTRNWAILAVEAGWSDKPVESIINNFGQGLRRSLKEGDKWLLVIDEPGRRTRFGYNPEFVDPSVKTETAAVQPTPLARDKPPVIPVNLDTRGAIEQVLKLHPKVWWKGADIATKIKTQRLAVGIPLNILKGRVHTCLRATVAAGKVDWLEKKVDKNTGTHYRFLPKGSQKQIPGTAPSQKTVNYVGSGKRFSSYRLMFEFILKAREGSFLNAHSLGLIAHKHQLMLYGQTGVQRIGSLTKSFKDAADFYRGTPWFKVLPSTKDTAETYGCVTVL